MTDHDEVPETDRADCRECKGSGSHRVLIGPDEAQAMCEACVGTGRELTREELSNPDRLLPVVDDGDDEEWI